MLSDDTLQSILVQPSPAQYSAYCTSSANLMVPKIKSYCMHFPPMLIDGSMYFQKCAMVLYYTILYHTILYCTTLYYTLLYSIILFYSILYYTRVV